LIGDKDAPVAQQKPFTSLSGYGNGAIGGWQAACRCTKEVMGLSLCIRATVFTMLIPVNRTSQEKQWPPMSKSVNGSGKSQKRA